jgi:2-polyprenyl-3-methyl-5-hydroxy-6-metoxy-1,4-benzoquinol methylase
MLTLEDEKKLAELIKKWTEPFNWRSNFSDWRYQRLWQENFQEKEIKFLENKFPDLKRKKILDLGCGMGGFLVAMRRRGYNIQGLEANDDYCQIARLRGKRYGIDLEIANTKGEETPFEAEGFDFIYCNDVLEHTENPRQILEKIYKILKPNGQVYITVINRFGFRDHHYQLKFINWMPRVVAEWIINLKNIQKEDSLAGRQRLSHMHYFTFRSFQKIAREIGFSIQDLNKYKIDNPGLVNNPRIRKMIKILTALRLINFIYRPISLFYFSGFRFLLEKNKLNSPLPNKDTNPA